MQKIFFLILFTMFLSMVILNSYVCAQAEPVMYFCERYDDYEGEVGIGDRFAKGSLTLMLRSDIPLNLDRITIRYDKYNADNGKFEYYKKSYFETERDANFLHFILNDENNLDFEQTGFYRVFLLDGEEQYIASTLIEIVN